MTQAHPRGRGALDHEPARGHRQADGHRHGVPARQGHSAPGPQVKQHLPHTQAVLPGWPLQPPGPVLQPERGEQVRERLARRHVDCQDRRLWSGHRQVDVEPVGQDESADGLDFVDGARGDHSKDCRSVHAQVGRVCVRGCALRAGHGTLALFE